jgi:hypothetical protein
MATMVTDINQAEQSTLSWGAVLAGGIASAALMLFFLALGVGLGLSTVSPWSDQGVSATTFSIGAGIYLVAATMLASTVGGYLAGRLRAKWIDLHDHETYFRDTAHGLVVWAVGLLLSATALGAATTHILAGASAGLAPAASAAAAASPVNPVDLSVDALLRADPAAPGAAPAPGATLQPSGDASATRAELSRLFVPLFRKGGDLAPADPTYVAKVVAARTGLSQADAEKRVSDVVTKAKQATDEARKATVKASLWLAASMLAGAIAAMLGATEGGLLRDSRWYEPGWRATIIRTHP